MTCKLTTCTCAVRRFHIRYHSQLYWAIWLKRSDWLNFTISALPKYCKLVHEIKIMDSSTDIINKLQAKLHERIAHYADYANRA